MRPINVPKNKIKLSKAKGVLERDVEEDNRKYAKRLGILFEKFTSPSKRSVPDRILTFPQGLIAFIEYKAPGKFPSDKQWLDHCERRSRGVLVYVVDSPETGRALIDRLMELDDYEDSGRKGHWVDLESRQNKGYYTCQKTGEC